MALSDPDEMAILRLTIEELRRTFDHISNIYDQLRTKALTLIGGEVAIVVFLFSDNKLLMPHEPYGLVFFWTAIVFLMLAFGLLLWTISPVAWQIPVEIADVTNIPARWQNEKSFLEYVRNEYVRCINHCNKYVVNRGRRFNWTIYLLSAGAIIVLLLKFGG
jgi:hypothetical protein